jgi:hypothetical protein
LTKHRVQDKESVRVPIHPFAYQSFPAFVAGLLARPGVEDMIDWAREQKNTEWEGTKDMWDIWDGLAIHELQGVNNKPFSNGPAGEARLVWNLSVDWFNPFMNKQSGKTASTGSMAMACLNLPPKHAPQTGKSVVVNYSWPAGTRNRSNQPLSPSSRRRPPEVMGRWHLVYQDLSAFERTTGPFHIVQPSHRLARR